jgi:hypothetical protein
MMRESAMMWMRMMARESAAMWMTATAQTRCCRWQRCGRRQATRSCGPPRSDGGDGGAQTAAGDGELKGGESATEEVLVPEARTVSSSLDRVLDVAAEMTILQGGSGGNRGGWGWCSSVSRGRWAAAEGKSREHVRGGESGVRELSPCAHARDKGGRSTWDDGDRRCMVTAASSRIVSRVHSR